MLYTQPKSPRFDSSAHADKTLLDRGDVRICILYGEIAQKPIGDVDEGGGGGETATGAARASDLNTLRG